MQRRNHIPSLVMGPIIDKNNKAISCNSLRILKLNHLFLQNIRSHMQCGFFVNKESQKPVSVHISSELHACSFPYHESCLTVYVMLSTQIVKPCPQLHHVSSKASLHSGIATPLDIHQKLQRVTCKTSFCYGNSYNWPRTMRRKSNNVPTEKNPNRFLNHYNATGNYLPGNRTGQRA